MYHYRYSYYTDIPFMDEICAFNADKAINYPISIHQINISGKIIRKYKNLNNFELKAKKREILELIQEDKLKNTFEDLLTYIQTV